MTIPKSSRKFRNSMSTHSGDAISYLRHWGWYCKAPKRHRPLCWKGECVLVVLDLRLFILLLHPRGKSLVDLFAAIDEGEVALMTAPPAGAFRRLQANDDRQHRWIRDHWTHRPQNLWSMLQLCVESCQAAYGHLPKHVAIAKLRKDISKDLVLMRQQPVLMAEYRRYVVLDSKSSSSADGLGVS